MLGMWGDGEEERAFRGGSAKFEGSGRATSGACGGDRRRSGWLGGGEGGSKNGSRDERAGMCCSSKILTTCVG